MPDNKSQYIIQLGDRALNWDAEKLERNSQKLASDFPDAQIYQIDDYDVTEEPDKALSYIVNIGGRNLQWDADKLARNKEKLYKDFPDAKVQKVSAWKNPYIKSETQIAKENLDAFRAENGAFLDDFEARDTAERKMATANAMKGVAVPLEGGISGEERARYQDLSKQEEDLKRAYYNSPDVLLARLGRGDYIGSMQKDIEKNLSRLENDNPDAYRELRQSSARRANPRTALMEAKPLSLGAQGFQEDYTNYKTAQSLLDDAIKTNNAPSRYDSTKGFANFFRGTGNTFSDADFWTAGLTEIAEDFKIRDVLATVQEKLGNLDDLSDEAIDGILSDSEKKVLAAYLINAETQIDRAEDLSRAFQAGQGAAESAGFMAEFILTGGWSAGARKVVKAGAKKALGDYLGKLAGKATKTAVGKYTKRLAGDAIEAAARTLVMPSTYRNMAQQAIQINEDPETGERKLASVSEFVAKGFADSFIEALAEGGRVGALGDFFGDVLGSIKPAKALMDKIKKSDIATLVKTINNTEALSMLRAGGWHGIGEEYLEEWYGAALRTMTNLEPEALKDFATVDNQLITLTSFIPMTLIGGTASTVQVTQSKRDLEKKAALLKSAMIDRGYTEDQANLLVDNLRSAPMQNISDVFTPMVNKMAEQENGNAPELMKAVSDFALASAKMQTYGFAYDEQEAMQREVLRRDMYEQIGRFWQEDADGNRSVELSTLEDGTQVYILEHEKPSETPTEKGTTILGHDAMAVDMQGNVRFINMVGESQTMSLDDYLNTRLIERRGAEEERRMAEESELYINNVKSQIVLNQTVLNMGTQENPAQGIVVGMTPNGVMVQTQEGMVPLSWNEVGNKLSLPNPVMSDAQIEEAEVATLAAEQAAREAMLNEQFDNPVGAEEELARGNAAEQAAEDAAYNYPIKEDGSVDGNALWNENVREWVKWNNQRIADKYGASDNGADSVNYLQTQIASLEKSAKRITSNKNKETDLDKRMQLEDNEIAVNKRLAELRSILTELTGQEFMTEQEQTAAATDNVEAEQAAGAPADNAAESSKPRERSIESEVAHLYDMGLNNDEVKANLEAQVERAQEALNAQSKKAPKMGADAEAYVSKKREHAAMMQELQQELDFWNGALQAVNETLSQQSVIPDTSGSVAVEDDPEPQNAVEFAARELGLRDGGIKLLWDSFKYHTGYGEAERRKFFGLFRTRQKGGMTIEEAGERLMELDRENGTGFFDQNDPNAGMNAILDALGDNQTMGELRSYTARQRQEEAQREADAAYSAMMAEYEATYGMSVEEVDAYDAVMNAELLQKGLSETEYNELNSIFAEEISEYDNRTEDAFRQSDGTVPSDVDRGGETVLEGSDNVLQSPQSDNSTAEGGALEGEQSIQDVDDVQSQDGNPQVQPAVPTVESSLDEDMPDFTSSASAYFPNEEMRQKFSAMRARINEWAQKLGVQVRIMETLDDVVNPSARKAVLNGNKVYGYFDPATGEVAFYLPDFLSIKGHELTEDEFLSEIDKTYIHEVVAHRGLRGLLGEEKYGALCDKVWDLMTEQQKANFLNYPGVNGNSRIAADEFIAHFAENVDYNDNRTLWDKIVDFIKDLLPININIESNEDIAYLLRHSYIKLAKNAEAAINANANQQAEGNVNFRTQDISDFAQKHHISEKFVSDFADAMSRNSSGAAAYALKEIKRELRINNVNLTFGEFAHMYAPIKQELFEQYGDYDALHEAEMQRTIEARNLMEAAEQKAREEAEKEMQRLKEFEDMDDIALDEAYFVAIETGDESRMRDIINEAARRNGYEDTDFRMAHKAPSYDEYGYDGSLVDVANNLNGFRDSIEEQFRMNRDIARQESVDAIRKAFTAIEKGQTPSVKVYRAVPRGLQEGSLRNGDWVTLSRAYAVAHGENALEGGYDIMESSVPASELYWDGNDINEWGYDDKSDYKYKNTTNNRKLNILVTRDNNGNIIPPSQRFNEKVDDVRFRSTPSDKVVSLFNQAKNGELKGKPVKVGTLTKDGKAYLERISGIKLKENISFVLNPSDLNHIYNDHYGKNEKDTGNNIPLNDYDIRRLVDVIAFPSSVVFGEDKQGRKVFYFLSETPSGTYNLMEIYANKKGNLTAKTYYKTKKGATQRVMELESLLSTSETYSGATLSDAKIPILFDIANQGNDNILFRTRITPEQDAAYMKAVESGDMEAAQRMVNEAARLAGYDSNSDYQGSLAFNGAAPSGYGYYDTKEERIEAWENGEYEDDQTLGDYKDAGIDISNLGWNLTSPVARKMGNEYTRESIKNLADAINNDSRKIKIYRAVDANIKEDSIRNGDWVTPSRAYAEYHIGLQDWKEGRIIEQEVDIDDIWWDGNDINEWGYNDGKGYAYKNTPNNRKLLAPVTYDNNGNVIPLSERFNPENDDIRFRTSNNNQAIFVSNAAKAVEGIKQEKATPEQWLKMIEKNGGLKAGEDKWMGLSDWLKESDKKTLTKQEVLDFVNEHMIQIEEVHYAAGAEDDAENTYAMIERILQEKFDKYIAEYYEQNSGEDDDLYGGDSYEYAMDKLREEMNDEFPYTIERSNSVVYLTFPYEETDDLQEWADKLGINFAPQNPINYTRLDYTTDGLNNKHEIALIVPSIESWNEGDEVHFGDAGDGRAIAWIRFGETWEQRPSPQISRKVLVIDEIQSKRHQAGREKGYTNKKAFEKAMAELEEVGADRLKRRSALIKTLYEKYGQSLFDFMKSEGTEYNRRLVPNEEVMTPDEVQEYYATSQDDIYQEEARLKEQYLEGVPDAPFDKNWHELAMKRMLRYAAENGYDVIAWTKGEQQAERYNIGKVIDSIYYGNLNGNKIVRLTLYGADNQVAEVDSEGRVVAVHSGNMIQEGMSLAEIVGKEIALKIMNNEGEKVGEDDYKLSGEGLRVGGEGMKGFYDKILPAFMNKYGKKWGVKVDDIALPGLEDGNLTMHSVPVTEEMKASVMEGQVMFRARMEDESAEDFTQAEVDTYYSKYNDLAETVVSPVDEITAREHGYTLEELKKIYGQYEAEKDIITIFAQEENYDGDRIEITLFHESIHKLADFYPYLVKAGEWMMNNADRFNTFAGFRDIIVDEYEQEWHNEEMLCYALSACMNAGVTEEVMTLMPQEYRKNVEQILNEIGYDTTTEGGRRKARRGLSESAVSEDLRDAEGKSESGRSGKETKGSSRAEFSAEERRLINEYFPGAFTDPIEQARQEVDQKPTDAQKEAGNYRKGHLHLDGYNITIENPKGSVRRGTDSKGNAWENTLNNDYGYIRGTEGVDGDHIDVYLSDNPTEGNVFVVDQVNPETREFDEHKVMYGFSSAEEAREAYLANFSEGWNGLGTITEVSKDEFKKWIDSSHRKTKPFSEYKSVRANSDFGPIYEQFRGKPKEAVAFLMEKKSGEAVGALSHPEIGEIDLVWGEEGTGKSDGYGLAKLVKFHPEVVDNLQEILNEMSIVKRSPNRINLESDKYQAAVRLTWDNKKKTWLLTAFEKKNSVLDNTTDTDETSKRSKQNDTATLQDTVSEGKDNTNQENINDVEGNIPYRTLNATPTDELVTKGLQLTPDQTAELAGNIFAALPEESRKKITDSLNGNILGLQDAILQIPASLAAKEEWNEEDWKIARAIASEVQKVIDVPATRKLHVSEALWMLYDATHNSSFNIIEAAQKAFVKDRFGFSERGMKQKEEDVRFRAATQAEIDAMERNMTAADLYNRDVTSAIMRLRESFQDMYRSVQKMVDAIVKKTGKDVKPFENIMLALNQLSSKNLADKGNFLRKYLMPMWDAVLAFKEKGYSIDDVTRYVMLKHGLERNDVLAQRDARNYYKDAYDKKVREIEADKSLSDTDKQKKKDKANADYDFHLASIESGSDAKYRELRERDYGAVMALYSDYVDIPDRMPGETIEQFNQRQKMARRPKFTDLAVAEAEAAREVDAFENANRTLCDRLWKSINAATKETLKHQYEHNVISKQAYDHVKGMFKFYVPLRGFKEDTAEDIYSYYGKDISTDFANPLIKTKGRTTLAESPFGWIGSMAESAIQMDNKNDAKMRLYYFAVNRPEQNLLTLQKTWYKKVGEDSDGKAIWEASYPKITPDMDHNQTHQEIERHDAEMKALAASGQATQKKSELNLRNSVVNISDKAKPEHAITILIGGEERVMYVNGNPRAAQAINGMLNIDRGDSVIYRVLGQKITRWMAQLNTSYNPAFWISNYQRDLLFTIMGINVKEDKDYQKLFWSNYTNPAKVTQLLRKYEKGELDMSNSIEKAYKEFADNGGVTGYTVLANNEEYDKLLEKYARDAERSKFLKGAKKTFGAIQDFGEGVEQASRFAAYLTSRQVGRSIEEAIGDAKDVTVNFNRKGSGKDISWNETAGLSYGRYIDSHPKLKWCARVMTMLASSLAPAGRSVYMFFNASIQGLKAFVSLYKKNPGKAAMWSGAYFGLSFALVGLNHMINSMLGGDDDDYLDIPDWERRNNILIGGGGFYLKWSIPQEVRPIYALADIIYNKLAGRSPDENIVEEVARALFEVLPVNPLGVGGFIRNIMPSATTPIFDIIANTDYKGMPLYRESHWSTGEEPKYDKAFTSTGKVFVEISRLLNNVTGGDYAEAGAINIHPAAIEHIIEGYGGGTVTFFNQLLKTLTGNYGEGEWSVRNTPFLNRVVTINDERYRNSHTSDLFRYYEELAKETKRIYSVYKSNDDIDKVDELMDQKRFEIMRIYENYRKREKRYDDLIRDAEDDREKRELMAEQDEMRRDMIQEISELP